MKEFAGEVSCKTYRVRAVEPRFSRSGEDRFEAVEPNFMPKRERLSSPRSGVLDQNQVKTVAKPFEIVEGQEPQFHEKSVKDDAESRVVPVRFKNQDLIKNLPREAMNSEAKRSQDLMEKRGR